MNLSLKLVVLSLLLGAIGCATSVQSNLEEAQFALDKGQYTLAITKGEAVLASQPQNARAARIVASAYFGRSGIVFFDMAEAVTELEDGADTNFKIMADVLPTTADMDDLHAAITTLSALDGLDATSITNSDLADAAFDLGMMEIIEQFALGVYGSNYKTSLDAANITQTQATFAINDLVNFDNLLISSGVSTSENFLQETRHVFCILEPITAGEGFTLGEYQAYVGCQLSADSESFDTTAYSADIADCSVLDPDSQSDEVSNCYNTDTAL